MKTSNKMAVLIGAISPHPPLLIPEVGGREREKVRRTDLSLKRMAEEFKSLNLDTIIIISPHAPYIYNSISIYSSDVLYGDFSQFGAPHIYLEYENDELIVKELIKQGREKGVNFVPLSPDTPLDHATMVPLYYLNEAKIQSKLVAMSPEFTASRERLIEIGKFIRDVCEQTDKRIGLIASGDLSHRLSPYGPYGFTPNGPLFDREIVSAIENKDLQALLSIPEEVVEDAGECGFKPILMLIGALPFEEFTPEVLSYEGPFGVGYMVSIFRR